MPKTKLVEMLEGGRERAVVRSTMGNVYLLEDVNRYQMDHPTLLATSVVGCRTLALALLKLSDRMARGE